MDGMGMIGIPHEMSDIWNGMAWTYRQDGT
jgi:hypothetical protein